MSQSEAKKGFAALNSMVSDIEATVAARPASRADDAKAATVDTPPAATVEPSSSTPAEPERGSGLWMLIVPVVLIILLAIFVLGTNSKNESNPGSTLESSASTPAAYTPVPVEKTSAPEVQPSQVPSESMPPAGRELVLSASQIRYCLSEKLRIQVWRTRIESTSEPSLQPFNDAVSDYNSRCSDFRYRGNTLETIRAEVEANRAALTQEAISRAERFEVSAAPLSMPVPPILPTTSTIPAAPVDFANIPGKSSNLNDSTSFPVAASPQTFTTSFDCTKASVDAEHIICGDAELAASDVELASLFAQAQAASVDKDGFKQHVRQQWNDRQRYCHDRDCLVHWYERQKTWLTAVVSGQVLSNAKPADAAIHWAQALAQQHADAEAAYDLAKRHLDAVHASCPDAILMQQTPQKSGPYKPVVLFLSRQCGYIVSYWPDSGEEQISFDRTMIENWSGYCSTRVGPQTTCIKGNGA
ncbi:hypothetical protein [Caballeronia sp. LZ043]|uniref:lysozyme inhibitor LprI family protein n=1 Tax=Caballeronia sp. LZ043 TaxID=3038569 RepID=UPI002860F2DE|nr:hypothetical protein [Caballeronia sp. LZ043]MDR5821754.1 hypothetical protein [Caballeronia sp. LZ043]